MVYKLPNGKQVEISKISSVSKVRDLGRNPKSIDTNLIGFTIHLKGREIVEVTEDYHFVDWAEVKNRVKRIREELLNLCKAEEDKEN